MLFTAWLVESCWLIMLTFHKCYYLPGRNVMPFPLPVRHFLSFGLGWLSVKPAHWNKLQILDLVSLVPLQGLAFDSESIRSFCKRFENHLNLSGTPWFLNSVITYNKNISCFVCFVLTVCFLSKSCNVITMMPKWLFCVASFSIAGNGTDIVFPQ